MKGNFPIVLLGTALASIVVVSGFTTPRNPDGRGFWWVIFTWPEGVSVLALLLTLFFIAWQALLMRQSVSASDEVSKRELRAYLTVAIGEAIFQQRRPQKNGGDLKFESRPLIVNTGRTPARQIVFKARAAIMPLPLPKTVHLPDAPDQDAAGSILGPQQTAFLSGIVDGFCADNEVDSIKYTSGDKALYVWGLVTYEDVFGEEHHTRFCQQIYWDLKDNVRGHYVPGRNDAN